MKQAPLIGASLNRASLSEAPLIETPVRELGIDPFAVFADSWMLLTAGSREHGFNTMTIAWGHLGSIWRGPTGTMHEDTRIPTAICYVRPTRYTKEFMDSEDLFTLSRLPEQFRRELAYLGTRSGRNTDKIAQSGLTPVFDNGTVHFAEADLVLVCRKIYAAPFVETGFNDHAIMDFNYPERDFHTMYMGEIIRALKA